MDKEKVSPAWAARAGENLPTLKSLVSKMKVTQIRLESVLQ